MIIAVSDLHLGSPTANKIGFQGFIRDFLEPNQSDISHLVLLGDILDLWRNTNSRVLTENADIITELGQLDMKKSYIIGNHDYAILNLLSDNETGPSVQLETAGALDYVIESLELNQDGLQLKFIHGHQIDYLAILRFYTVFSQAMCFVDINDQYLYNVWNIVSQFASDLSPKVQTRLKDLSRQSQIDLEQKLAGPLDGNIQGEKTGLLYEWNLLKSVMDLGELTVSKDVTPHFQEQIKQLSGVVQEKHSGLVPLVETLAKSTDPISDFAALWEGMITWVDRYLNPAAISETIANPIHMGRRIAATVTTGLRNDEFLIRGRGHSPYVSQTARVADTGCWIGSQGSYIQINEGQVSVHNWGS